MRSSIRGCLCLLPLLFCASLHSQSPPDLFKAISQFGPIEPTDLSGGIAVEKYRVVQTQTSLISEAAASNAQQGKPKSFGSSKDRPTIKVVNLNLFDNVSFIADFKNVITSLDGKTITWSGTIRGASESSVTLAVTGRTVFGNVTTGAGTVYEIRPLGGPDAATQAILQVSERSFPKESKPVPIKGLPMSQDINPNAPPALLNVLVVYTQAAAGAAGAPGIKGLAHVAESETNTGYFNSGVKQSIQVVEVLPVQYDEKDGYALALQRLADPHDNYMDEVHQARAKVHADMVVLLIKNAQSCGLSYLAQPPTPDFASKAFSVVNVGCATGLFSFGHELGHLQGCNHNRETGDGPGAFPYSYGYEQTSKNPHFRDIMSYDCASSCTRINYWSNPDIQFQGLPVGENSVLGTTNNAQTLNRTQYIASGWRP